jgi:hypothetical protein
VRSWLSVLAVFMLIGGCRAGTAAQELEQLRARTSTLEAENAHLQGQLSLVESERDRLREQVNQLAAQAAKAEAGLGGAGGAVSQGEHLVVMPREVRPGEWIAVHVRNYPLRLLPNAAVALRSTAGLNLTHVGQLHAANIFLLPVPPKAEPGTYSVVIGEAGPLGPEAKLDDQVPITVKAP